MTIKKTAIILVAAAFIASCGNSDSGNRESGENINAAEHSAAGRQSEAADDTAKNNIGTQNEAGANGSTKGAQLVSGSDCMSCHRDNEKLVGPAYSEVAKKYSNTDENVDMLAGKIIKGGAGNWGEIPMTPHPTISKDDAREMAKYVLSIK